MFKDYKKEYLMKDIAAGIIVALISIPISMGYAQVAGLPVIYGLYGSLFPVILFGLISSSPQFVFGVDAAPAALVGGTLATMGIASGSAEAMQLVPVITFMTACWLMLFYVLRAGRLVNYISKPVLGGFISGIGCTIILMQVSKLFGGAAGSGEVFQLLYHIAGQFGEFNMLSAAMGVGTVLLVLAMKKAAPKFPMSVVMMVLGALSTAVFHVDKYGVKLLPEVEPGLPHFVMLDFSALFRDGGSHFLDLMMMALTIALVIVSSTLLMTNNYAVKYGYKVQNNREILAYSLSNLLAAFQGCCPLNGSVSRTGMADQFGCKSQVMSLSAGVVMAFVLLFGTGFISYLPVPVLTGIVIAALIGILEFGMAKKLWHADRMEFFIFMGAFLGVLILGTIYGVIIGVVLSFTAVVKRATIPPKAYLGMIPGRDGFYSLARSRNAHSIRNTVVYRFSGSLFFANIDAFQQDIENAASPDVHQIIVDASGIGSVDITAAERLVLINENLRSKGVRFYLTEHVEALNDSLRRLGAGSLVEQGVVRRTISLALRDAGVERPYPLDERDGVHPDARVIEQNDQLAEFEWAFGEEAEARMEELAKEVGRKMSEEDTYNAKDAILEAERNTAWGRIGLFDEEELLDHLKMHLAEIAQQSHHDPHEIEEKIEQRRAVVEQKLQNLNPEALKLLKKHRDELARHYREEKNKADD